MDDVSKAVSMDFKKAGNLIYIVGNTSDELGGSIYYKLFGAVGNNAPKVNVNSGRKIMASLSKAINSGLINSCHDCSEGGVAVSLSEMCFAGGLGAEIELKKVPYKVHDVQQSTVHSSQPTAHSSKPKAQDDIILFSESNTRFIVEVSPQNQNKFESVMKNLPIGLIGHVVSGDFLKIYGQNKNLAIDANIKDLKEAWQAPLRF